MYDHLKELRESLGLTQAQFGKSIGIAKSTYNNYETGIREPKSDFWIAVAQKYDVTIDYLMGYTSDPHERSDTSVDLSPDATRLATDYDLLDSYGKRIVRLVTDEEKRRCISMLQKRQRQKDTETSEDISGDTVYFTVPEYSLPMSAGTGQLAGDEWAEDLLLTKAPPRGTSYVAHVKGDSMEPTYHDGDRLFVHSTVEIDPGQIGVFWMDGKQWVKERGDGVLISHNKRYDPIPFTEGIQCQGLVLGVCDESYF